MKIIFPFTLNNYGITTVKISGQLKFYTKVKQKWPLALPLS